MFVVVAQIEDWNGAETIGDLTDAGCTKLESAVKAALEAEGCVVAIVDTEGGWVQ